MKTTNETIEAYVKRKGIKHKIIAQSMNMQVTTWYKNRQRCCKNVSIEEIHNLAQFLKITPYKAFELTYNLYLKTNNNNLSKKPFI
jgi:anaerobic ribonucleoside-triphosphate reductase